jgi:glycerol-3-phosphate acyltransferase PlsY
MLVIILLLSYLIGSIPTSIITAKVLKGIDIRDYGSGNAGGTNTFRVLGWRAGLFVSAVDVFKGFAAAFWIARPAYGAFGLEPEALQLLAGCAAVAGHVWTVFARFRGGKGVAAAAGLLLALNWQALLICVALFAALLFAFRIVSLASICAALSLPLVLSVLRYLLNRPVADSLYYFSFAAAAFIIFTHRSNIKRLLSGGENSFKKKK